MEAEVQVSLTSYLTSTRTEACVARFDRVYIRPSESNNLVAEQFGLVGLKRVEGTQSFPSDHWGLRLSLKLSQEQ